MTGNPLSNARSEAEPHSATMSARPVAQSPPAASDQLDKLAALVADGQIPLPTDLAPRDRATLLVEVGLRRRARLIGFIARAIAWDLRQARTSERDVSHAQENI